MVLEQVKMDPLPEVDPNATYEPPTKEQIGEKLNELDKELKMTNKEKDRLAECFKDQEFMGMFTDYMKEISDPKNRAEYNEYIRQCERDGDKAGMVPEGMQLILPKVGFCLKVTSTTKGDNSKVFVNITHTEKVKEFSCVRVPGQGEQWAMPFCLDNPKPDVDSQDKPVTVYTIAFNSKGYEDFQRVAARREFLIAVACENIEMSFKDDFEKAGPEDAICRYVYKEMKNLKFKGPDGRPTVLSCKQDDMNPSEMTSTGTFGHEQKDAPPGAPKPTGPAKKRKGKKKKKDKGAYGSKGFFDNKPKKNGLIEDLGDVEDEEEQEEEEEEEPEEGVCKPKYTLVHRGQFEMQQHMLGESASAVESCRPRELIVKIQLPRVDSARDVDLDVSAERLVLQVEGKYDLLLDLPFPVDEENGSAKFDKALHVMSVTLPVLKEDLPELPQRVVPEEQPEEEEPEELLALREGDGVTVEVGGADGGAGFTCTDDLVVDGIAPDGLSAEAGVRVGMQLVAFEAGSHAWNAWQEDSDLTWDGMYRLVANASRPWRFTFAPSDGEEPVEEGQGSAVDSLGIEAAEMTAGFYPCECFSGARERYYFGTGESGVGYYRDVPWKSGSAAAPAPAPVVETEMATNVRAANPVETTAAAKDAASAAASSPTGGLGGFENSIMLELD